MRLFLFFLLLVPAFAALGHDVYIYTENPEKGFRLSDVGKLWDTYHKESHDKWKVTLGEITETVEDSLESVLPADENTSQNAPAIYQEGFSQSDKKGQTQDLPPPPQEKVIQKKSGELQKFVGFLLEQKAVYVFGGLALVLIIFISLLGYIFKPREKTDKISDMKKVGKKGKNYSYGRK